MALLMGVREFLNTGEAFFSRDSLIELCKKYSVYDYSNFAKHMTKNKDLFLAKGDGWVLTVPGQEKAASVIKELA